MTAGRSPDLFVLPTYHVGQVENAQRSARLAATYGFTPVIVCNSSNVATLLSEDPFCLSSGSNTGYGGAAALVAGVRDFSTMVLCNDDLLFTDRAMSELSQAVNGFQPGQEVIAGLLPMSRPRIAGLPGMFGTLALVSGLSALTRGLAERRTRVVYRSDLGSTSDGLRELPNGLGFPFVCVAITRSAWDRLGGFDARFPLYFEDTDLLTRAHRADTVRIGVILAECTHLNSATARTVLPYIVPLMSVGARTYLQLHRRCPSVVATILVTIALFVRASCWVPMRSDRRAELQAVRRALVASWSLRTTQMPPWD